jgi:3-phosphoshikimate 1-carboxyvinyltransferase
MKQIKTQNAIQARVRVPGSKSITQRALIAAALAKGDSKLIGPLESEDTRYTSAALAAMGIVCSRQRGNWLVKGRGGVVTTPAEPIYLGNNGTATRFLTSVAALGNGTFRITGDERMAERPIKPLMEALAGWGVDIVSEYDTGCPPLLIQAAGIAGGKTLLPAGKSSQYLSSLLLVAPYAGSPAALDVEGEVPSKPYVTMTMAVMESFGVVVEANEGLNRFQVPQGCYRGREYHIEGDASSASYFWAAAAVTGGSVTVENVPLPSLQGDVALVRFFEQMGCAVHSGAGGITVTGTGTLRGIEVDMGDCPDVAPTLAMVAAMAEGRTVIRNIAHLRIKECDRINAVATELAKLGVAVREEPDALIIEGVGAGRSALKGAMINTYNDHRIAMCFAVAGLVVPGISIDGEDCVRKSFPDFWECFDRMIN